MRRIIMIICWMVLACCALANATASCNIHIFNSNEDADMAASVTDGEFEAFAELYSDSLGMYAGGYSLDDASFSTHYYAYDVMSGASLLYDASFVAHDAITSWESRVFDCHASVGVSTRARA